MKTYKTTGLNWLELSIISFNGSGYANRTNAEAFIQSYIDYKDWKRKPEAVKLANKYYHSVLPLAEHLLPSQPNHVANAKNYQKFLKHIGQS